MSDTTRGTHKGSNTFDKYDPEEHKRISSKGGKATGVKKGFAWIKENDPERFAAIIAKRESKRRAAKS